MPRNSRKSLPGLFYHIMSQGINKEYIFYDNILKEKYKNILNEKMKQNNINILSYCIMDNHIHLLIKVEKNEDMCKFMQQVNTTYAKFYNKINNRVGYVFRNRYLAKPILEEKQLKRCVVYIHRNPVVANMIQKEGDYKFSSYNEYINDKNEENLICSNSNKMLFGKISKNELTNEYNKIHNYKDIELKEFDDFDERKQIDFEGLLEKYSYLSEDEKILKLNLNEKISERKLAEIFNKTRHQVRKIIKQGVETKE